VLLTGMKWVSEITVATELEYCKKGTNGNTIALKNLPTGARCGTGLLQARHTSARISCQPNVPGTLERLTLSRHQHPGSSHTCESHFGCVRSCPIRKNSTNSTSGQSSSNKNSMRAPYQVRVVELQNVSQEEREGNANAAFVAERRIRKCHTCGYMQGSRPVSVNATTKVCSPETARHSTAPRLAHRFRRWPSAQQIDQ
jgi:hypothetical protein